MASERHNFIVSAIARKIKSNGFRILYLDGRYQDIDTIKFDIPPKIINHRPDIVAEKDDIYFCIGEAKTKNDISSKRTTNQISDFFKIVKTNSENRLIIGVPSGAKTDLEKLLFKLGIVNQKQIEIIYIPEALLPDEQEI